MVDHYLHTAYRAAHLLYPHRHAIALSSAEPGAVVVTHLDREQAMQWFTREHSVLIAILDHASRADLHARVRQLAWSVATYLDRRGHWDHQATTFGKGLAAARVGDDRLGQAHAHHGLAGAHTWLHEYEVAQERYARSLALFEELGDTTAQAHGLLNRALLYEQQGSVVDALDAARRSLRLFEAIGHCSGSAKALNAVGWFEAVLGDHRSGLSHCQQALALLQEGGDQYGEAFTWDSLGFLIEECIRRERAVTKPGLVPDRHRDVVRQAAFVPHDAVLVGQKAILKHGQLGLVPQRRYLCRESVVTNQLLPRSARQFVRGKRAVPVPDHEPRPATGVLKVATRPGPASLRSQHRSGASTDQKLRGRPSRDLAPDRQTPSNGWRRGGSTNMIA